MKASKRLGGWWRLWVILSASWIAVSAGFSDWSRPDAVIVKSWGYWSPALNEINAVRRDLCTKADWAFLYNFKGPYDGLVMPTAAISNKGEGRKVVDLQCRERTGMARRVRENLIKALALPLGLLLFGLAIFWVRIGFKNQREKATDDA